MSVTPCRERLVAAVFGVMQTVSILPAERNRRESLKGAGSESGGASELPRQILFEDDEKPVELFCGEDAFELPLLIQVAIEKAGAEAATECNSLRAQLRQALMADRTLGGLARDVEITEPGDWIGIDVDADDFEGFMLGLLVKYATKENDPFTFSNGG